MKMALTKIFSGSIIHVLDAMTPVVVRQLCSGRHCPTLPESRFFSDGQSRGASLSQGLEPITPEEKYAFICLQGGRPCRRRSASDGGYLLILEGMG
jgi:hypothetical protein